MAHQLNSPVTSTTLNIPFILVDRYQYVSPLVRHLVLSKNMVEQLGYPYYSYVPEASPHLDWDIIRSHRLTSFYPFQRLSDLRFLILCTKRLLVSSKESSNWKVVSVFLPLNNLSKYSCHQCWISSSFTKRCSLLSLMHLTWLKPLVFLSRTHRHPNENFHF